MSKFNIQIPERDLICKCGHSKSAHAISCIRADCRCQKFELAEKEEKVKEIEEGKIWWE